MTTLALVVSLGLCVPQAEPETPFVQAYVEQATRELANGDPTAALASVRRALERDARNLPALRLLAEIAERVDDSDVAVHGWHRWLEVFDGQKRPTATKQDRRGVEKHLLELDPEAKAWSRLQRSYVSGLAKLGRDYQKREDWLGAIDVYTHLLQIEPEHRGARAQIANIRREGGREVAVEDVFAGTGDPTEGRSTAAIEAEDRKHVDWDDAYEKSTDNYRYRTNAGFLVLQTSAIAMEQMNRFYRRFFKYKEDGGKTPKIEIRIFKNRDEYLELGANPAKWSGGHFIGSAVETFVGGVTGRESIRAMYRTLFHEAAHQFVSLTGAFVPGWLNEAYASFFEGCVILSNGTVKWNLAPPGRLLPLAKRLEAGFMKAASEAKTDSDGDWITPKQAPPFGMVVAGDYRWGPPWYAPTWGVVYFLYNYRHDDGRPVFRTALHDYYQSFKRGRPTDPIAHFEETVLAASPLSPVETVAALDPIWKQWILDLRDRETGETSSGDELLRFADAALERGEKAMALEFLDEARENDPDDADLTWRTATLLEELDQDARAAALYREFKRSLEIAGNSDDERHAEAQRKIVRLDPLWRRYRQVKADLAEKGLALARGYEARELPTMALEIAKRMSASFSIPEALDYYVALARRTQKSLARWRVAYNERSLDGWSGQSESYQAYGKLLRAEVPPSNDAGLRTRQLMCDVTFDGDFSLEAEMQVLSDSDGAPGQLVGLCFGVKGDSDFHAALLHPRGFLDVSTNRGGEWTIHDHRSADVGTDWHTLRIDVTDRQLDVYLDGLFVRSLDFKSRATVRGGFGLITGAGRAQYRNIRVLARDPHDPAARIERQLAMERVAADESLRQPGTFTGFRPPELDVAGWFQGEPTTLAELRGRPVALVFWAPRVDRIIPCTRYLGSLLARGTTARCEMVIVCEGSTRVTELTSHLEDHPIPGARIAIDRDGGPTYDDYYVKAGHHGVPRILLITADGKVTFEGDPGLTSGRGWKPGDGKTFVDDAFDRLIGK